MCLNDLEYAICPQVREKDTALWLSNLKDLWLGPKECCVAFHSFMDSLIHFSTSICIFDACFLRTRSRAREESGDIQDIQQIATVQSDKCSIERSSECTGGRMASTKQKQ